MRVLVGCRPSSCLRSRRLFGSSGIGVVGSGCTRARVVYTTKAIEALNWQLRKAIKTKGHFPNEEAARKLIYLAITNAVPAWTRTRNWTTALLAFKIHFGDRLPE